MRFHRPPWGIGLNEDAQAHVQSAVMFAGQMDIFSAEPNMELLKNRNPGSAWLLANPGVQYAVYFPSGGTADLTLDGEHELTIKWLNIDQSSWQDGEILQSGDTLRLTTPGDGHWIALITEGE